MPQETREDIAVSIPFTVTADSEIITVTLASSNQTLIPDDYLLYDHNASSYTVVATPAFNQTGNARISMFLTDPDGNTGSTAFDITVTDTDDAMYFWNNYQAAVQSLTNDLMFPAGVAVSTFFWPCITPTHTTEQLLQVLYD